MQAGELLEELTALARAAGLEVRALRGPAGEGEPGAASGVCRVRGRVWVLLAASDPEEERIDVLARALVRHAGELLETRWLAPALRERLDAARGSGTG